VGGRLAFPTVRSQKILLHLLLVLRVAMRLSSPRERKTRNGRYGSSIDYVTVIAGMDALLYGLRLSSVSCCMKLYADRDPPSGLRQQTLLLLLLRQNDIILVEEAAPI
jgi:hypothetical protein